MKEEDKVKCKVTPPTVYETLSQQISRLNRIISPADPNEVPGDDYDTLRTFAALVTARELIRSNSNEGNRP